MIVVAGESLIDLIYSPKDPGTVLASPGGGPFNAARTIARLGRPARFLGRFSTDPFGRLLAATLAEDKVEMAFPERLTEPTALAVVTVDGTGVPRYWFHLAGTASFALDLPTAESAMTADTEALHIGTMGLAVEPMATALEGLARSLPPPVLLMLDPNWRAQAIPDAAAHRSRLRRLLPRTDVLKVSTEDLPFVVPGSDVSEAAAILLGWGARCVIVTDGPEEVRAFTGDIEVAVPVPPVKVVDTVGAGDALGGGFLAWWTERRLTRGQLADPGLLRAGLRAAAEVAAMTCGRAGADPPWRHELRTAQCWDDPAECP
jgi:fructokinase